MQSSKTAMVMNRLAGLVRVEAISAKRAQELVVEFRRNGCIDDLISGLWVDFDPGRVNDILAVADEFEKMR